MIEREKQALELIKTTVTQLLLFSSGILALTVTFLKEIVPDPTGTQRTLLLFCWLLHTLSSVAGIWTLLAISGSLRPMEVQSKSHLALEFPLNLYAPNIRIPSTLQLLSFLGGMIFIFLVGASVILKGEQAGTVQPATRSVFKSDGSDKPQPEAEGRSR